MRNVRPLALALLLAGLLASPALGDLVRNKDWSLSPEFAYLTTDAEKKAWKDVKTDEEADKLIALFWARRDPDLKTPVNEFKVEFDARVQQADKVFTEIRKKRGALTERGKVFILIGPPKTLTRAAGTKALPSKNPGSGEGFGEGRVEYNAPGSELGQSTARFTYEAKELPPWAGMHALIVDFAVEQTSDSLISGDNRAGGGGTGPADVRRLENKAVEVALRNPDLKQAPVYKTKEQVEGERKTATESAAEAAKGPTLTPAVREGLEKSLAEPKAFGPLSVFPIAYRDGATRLMVQLFVKAKDVTAPETAKIALLVRGKDGKDAARMEEAAALQKSKGDYFVDRTISVLPGEYDVAAALVDAAGAAITTAHRPVEVKPLPTGLEASPLLLAYNDLPADGAKPEEPFVISSRKFVLKGDGRFEKTDGLAYAVRIYNPAIDPATKKLTIKRTIKIKPTAGGAAIDVPQPPDEPTLAPETKDGKSTLVIDLAGAVVDANLGDYFRPGDYVMTFTVKDVVADKEVTFTAPMTLVAPAKK